MYLLRLFLYALVVPVALAALLETKSCKGSNPSSFKLSKPLLDVALDDKNKILKFFINTKIVDPNNMTSVVPVITDVNETTNRYTTFHATIWFMGKQIIDENKRFCDMLGVKNTTQYLQSPRFYSSSRPNTTIVVNPYGPIEVSNGYRISKREIEERLEDRDALDEQEVQELEEELETLRQEDEEYEEDVEQNDTEPTSAPLARRDDPEPASFDYSDESFDSSDGDDGVAYYDPVYDQNVAETTTPAPSAADVVAATVIPADPPSIDPATAVPYVDPNVPLGDPYPGILFSSSTSTGPASMVSSYSIPTSNPNHDISSIEFADSNKTIESLFSNSTGKLIGCPLYVNDSVYIYYEVDISEHYGKIGSFAARFSVVSNDEQNVLLSCSKVYITPTVVRAVQRAILYGALALLVITGVINFLTVIYSSYQESQNPFLFTASTICNENLLKQLDATVQRIIVYLQFALFTAGLNLNYPGFYQPLIALLKWCALLGFSLLTGNEFFSSTEQDNIYLTYNANGLNSLSYYGSYKKSGQNWWNFILTLFILIVLQCTIQALYFSVKYLRNKTGKKVFHNTTLKATLRRAASLSLGIALNNFMMFFGYPFLVLTLYLFQLAAQNKKEYFPSINNLKFDAFSRNVSYDSLFSPISYVKFRYSDSNSTGVIELSNDLLHSGYNITATNVTSNAITVINSSDGVAIGPVAFGAILFSLWMGLALFFVFRYLISFERWKVTLNDRVSKLYTSVNTILCWGFLYHHYNPSKNFYVIYDLVNVFLKSVVVAIIQFSGVSQVIILIVLEFASLVSLVLVKPFFLEMSWTTTRWMVPVARFLVTVLCIPFIPSLNYSEAVRTSVAFTHLSIHLVIALAFCGQLLYCFTTTIISIVKHRKKTCNEVLEQKLTHSTSMDEFQRQFEYRPVDNLLMPIAPVRPQPCQYSSSLYKNDNDTDSSIDKFTLTNPDFYYRHNASQTIRGLSKSFSDDVSILSEASSFTKQQETSDQRKKQTDYTTREADKIYKKYFLDENIDDDIRQLWESRMSRETPEDSDTTRKKFGQTKASSRMEKLFKKLKKEPVETGFHVSRPRPLVVKIPEEDENGEQSVTPTSISDEEAEEKDAVGRQSSTKTAKTWITESSVYEDAHSF